MSEPRTYRRDECVVFRKTREQHGELSNMAGGYPLLVNGLKIWSSEALYQACRYPFNPDVQRLILKEISPMTAKMRSKRFRDKTRPDWLPIRTQVMRWCLRAKLAQHWDRFGKLLLSTGELPIVEESRKDSFWGAKPQGDELLIGLNVLGRLLMELRLLLRTDGSELTCANPPAIPDFLLLGEQIRPVVPIEFDRSELPEHSKENRRHLFTHLGPDKTQL